MAEWINVHTHRPGKGVNIVDPCLGKVVLPEDGVVYYSAGIHPLSGEAEGEERLGEVTGLAEEGRIVAVGEAGLDRRGVVSMEQQRVWFEKQVLLAERFGLPVIVHGVRVVPELVGMAKRWMGKGGRWIVHGFNNRREALGELLRHGFYISVGRQVMNRESHAYRLLGEIPLERLFLETDDSEYAIEDIYRVVAERLELEEKELVEAIEDNFKRVFKV